MGNTFYCRAGGDLGNTFYCRAGGDLGNKTRTAAKCTEPKQEKEEKKKSWFGAWERDEWPYLPAANAPPSIVRPTSRV